MALRASTFIKGILLVLLLIILAAVALIALFDPNDYKEEIQTTVKEKTGRSLALNAPLKWTFYPWLGISTGDIAIGNRQGSDGKQFLSAKQASVRVKLMPLLKGDFVADTVVLDGAELFLQVNKDGSDNWSDLTSSNETAGAATPGESSIKRININGADIRNSQISYDDRAGGVSYRAVIRKAQTGIIDMQSPIPLAIDMTLSGSDLPETVVALNGTFAFDLEKQQYRIPDFDLALAMASQTPAKLNGSLEIDLPSQVVAVSDFNLSRGKSKASGQLKVKGFKGIPSLNGSLKLQEFVTADFIALTGKGVDDIPLLALPVSGSLDFEGGNNRMRLPAFDLLLDGQKIAGSVDATSLNPLKAEFSLDAGNIDIDKWMGSTAPDQKPANKDTKGKSALAQVELAGDARIASVMTGGMRIENIAVKLDHKANVMQLKELSAKALGIPVSGNMAITDPASKMQYEGSLKVAGFNPRNLLKQLGASVPVTADKKVLSKAGGRVDVSGNKNRIRMKTKGFTLDDSAISGSVSLAGFSSPAYKFNLRVDGIDLDRYMPPKSGKSGNAGSGPDDSHKALRGLNMDGKIVIGKLKVSEMRLGNFRTNIRATGSRFKLTEMSGSLYKGKFSGDISLDTGGKTLSWNANETFTGVSVGPLLRAIADSDRLSGVMNLTTSLNGSGTSIDRILSTVSGKAKFDFKNGSIKGVNIAQALRDVKARLKGRKPKKAGKQKTDFSQMSGSATIKNGLVTSNDLVAKTPFLRVTGKGTINLPQSSMNYLTNIKVVKTSKGQGGQEFSDLEGLTIPVRIKGPFSNLSYYPDIEQLLKERANQELDKKKEALKEKAKEKLREKLKLNKEATKKEIKEKAREKAKKSTEDKLKDGLLKGLGF